MADTGFTATVGFSSTSTPFDVVSIDSLPWWAVEALEVTPLNQATVFNKYMAGDTQDPGEVTFTFNYNATQSVPSRGSTETITITFPKHTSGAGTRATLVGTGFIQSVAFPALQRNQVQTAQLTFKFDGSTGPTYTAETTS
jgi:hypothetical protein